MAYELGNEALPEMATIVLVAEWIHFTLFGDNITHYKTESVHCWGLMNSATKLLMTLLTQSVDPLSNVKDSEAPRAVSEKERCPSLMWGSPFRV